MAVGLLDQEMLQTGRRGAVAICSEAHPDLAPEFEKLGVPIISLKWRPRGFVGLAFRASKFLTEGYAVRAKA